MLFRSGLLQRWRKIVGQYLQNPDSWHLIRYEDLVTNPDSILKLLLDYVELPREQLLPFSRFNLLKGGDYKLRKTNTVTTKSLHRFTHQLTPGQLDVFDYHLGAELKAFGYS